MSVYESIMAGLKEAVEDAKSGEKKLQRNTVSDPPMRENQADDKRTASSQ
ncbi:MAG: hypothetical protein LUI39_13910 [Lachnospiraceae bacterium]|nr:hypothetical protein [Lachnospiraceae bacterium]